MPELKVRAKLKAVPICDVCKYADPLFFEAVDRFEIYAFPESIREVKWSCCGIVFSVSTMKVQVGVDPEDNSEWFPIQCIELDEGLPS